MLCADTHVDIASSITSIYHDRLYKSINYRATPWHLSFATRIQRIAASPANRLATDVSSVRKDDICASGGVELDLV